MNRFLGRSRASEDLRGAVIALACIVLLAAAGTFVDVSALAAIAFCPLIVAAVIPTRIDVGDDGVRLAWLGARFFPFSSVSTIQPVGRDAVLTLKSGARVVLPIAPKRRAGAQKRDDLITRLHSALREYETASPHPSNARASRLKTEK